MPKKHYDTVSFAGVTNMMKNVVTIIGQLIRPANIKK